MAQTEQTSDFSAIYLAYSTFNTALDMLKGGIPPRIDRSVFRGQSGGTQAQIMSGFRSFGLIDEDGTPTAILPKLVEDDTRKATLKALIEDKYRAVIALHAANATERQINDKLAEYNVSGATLRKASAFFQKAADDVGIKLSIHAAKRQRKGSESAGSNGARAPRARRAPKRQAARAASRSVASEGDSLTVDLGAAGL